MRFWIFPSLFPPRALHWPPPTPDSPEGVDVALLGGVAAREDAGGLRLQLAHELGGQVGEVSAGQAAPVRQVACLLRQPLVHGAQLDPALQDHIARRQRLVDDALGVQVAHALLNVPNQHTAASAAALGEHLGAWKLLPFNLSRDTREKNGGGAVMKVCCRIT